MQIIENNEFSSEEEDNDDVGQLSEEHDDPNWDNKSMEDIRNVNERKTPTKQRKSIWVVLFLFIIILIITEMEMTIT